MNVRFIWVLTGLLLCGGVSFAQSDIEVSDSTSIDWGGGIGGDITPQIPNDPVTSMTISSTTLTLEGGESARLTVTFNARAKNKDVIWTVADSKVCSVSNNGTVTGFGKGTTTVTATSVADNSFQRSCTVTVTSDYVPMETGWVLQKGIEAPWQMRYIFYPVLDEYVEPANDRLGRTWHDLGFDDSQWQTLTGPMHSDGSGNYLWQGDDNAFCLRREFTLPRLDAGVLKFYVNNDDGIRFWVNGNLVIDYDDWSYGEYREYEIPSTAYVEGINQLAIFICQGGGGACLDYGLWFESRMPVASISIAPETLTLAGGERARLTATVLPDGAWQKDVEWSVADPTIAIVNHGGSVLGLKKGTTIVSATSKDGTNISARCVVTVTSDYEKDEALPNVPFEFYFIASEYDESTHSIPNHEDANLASASLQLTENIPTFVDGERLRIDDLCEGYIDLWDKWSNESGAYFFRQGEDCMTIVTKVTPRLDTGNVSDFISNRGDGYNYMWRIGDANAMFLHTGSDHPDNRVVLQSEEPQVLAVRVDGKSNYILLQNLTTGESKRVDGVEWGGDNNIFKFFYNDDGEYFLGDFYWVYYSFNLLTDQQLDYFINPEPSRIKQKLQIHQGWNWISHNMEKTQSLDIFNGDILEVKSQTRGVIRDSQYGLFGNLHELKPTEAYKVRASKDVNILLNGKPFNASKEAIDLKRGWNWIGYPLTQAKSPDEALTYLAASEEDVLVGKSGSAEYVDGQWIGDLEEMAPGLGYMLKVSSATSFHYNNSFATLTATPALRKKNRLALPWSVDEHQYANVMPLRAKIYLNGTVMDCDELTLVAFCNGECRGIGKNVNGTMFMNVHGNDGDEITYRAFHPATNLSFDIQERHSFQADVMGSYHSPVKLNIQNLPDGMEALTAKHSVEVYGLTGIRLFKQGTLNDLHLLPAGINILKMSDGTTRKVLIK